MCVRSSAKAEYKAVVIGVTELLWIQILLRDIELQVKDPMKVYCNNKVELGIHFMKEKIDFNELILPYIRTQVQVADIFTKRFSYSDFEKNVCKFNMFDMYIQFEGEC